MWKRFLLALVIAAAAVSGLAQLKEAAEAPR